MSVYEQMKLMRDKGAEHLLLAEAHSKVVSLPDWPRAERVILHCIRSFSWMSCEKTVSVGAPGIR